MHRKLAHLNHQLLRMKTDLAFIRLSAICKKFSADQPRMPAGQSGGGQWIGSNAGRAANRDDNWHPARQQMAARQLQAACKAQYERDLIECRIVRQSACYEQAMMRRVACEQGRPIPPLNY